MKWMVAVLLSSCLVAPAFAQEPLTPIEKEQLARAALLAQVDTLTQELAKWRREAADLAIRVSQLEVVLQQKLNAQYWAELKASIEANHPGQTLNEKGQLETKK
jgi:hypothetical protein